MNIFNKVKSKMSFQQKRTKKIAAMILKISEQVRAIVIEGCYYYFWE